MTAKRLQLLEQVLDHRQPDLTVAMAGVHKEHNVSAVLRTCDAVGVWEAHSLGQAGKLTVRRTAAAGVQRRVALRQHEDIAEGCRRLRERGFLLYAAHWSERSVDFRSVDYTRPCVILLGQELEGMPEAAAQAADAHVTIPMVGLVASLNVSVAAAVILYEAQRQREAAGMYAHPRLDEATRRETLFEWLHPRIARYCRQRGLRYPELDQEGHVIRESWERIRVSPAQT
ncbi:MAG: tRNA (guanosine(18)-2'-O)-methyltransferase TrmH [Ectothiorhodospiraceae bacterium]|nr:tRNA (guanosine(18)-2'-O)-methyltransferase TrmH [Ectothiorhodospiraceae bacterium]